MASKQELQQQSGKLVAINKQILEIKKKIQLSEGQRKALFEKYESEKNRNSEDIVRLKKEITELIVKVKEDRSLSAKSRVPCSRLEEVNYIGDKTCAEVLETLDLQIIDKSKQLDLLKYQTKKKEERLKELADEYQTLISGKLENYTKKRIEIPLRKTIQELQNSIQAVQIQWREAEHVRIRYREIKRSLQEDAARFESTVNHTNQQLQAQQVDIERLQQINSEANKMRGIARNILLQEEKGAVRSATTRERQEAEGKRLIVERKQELEKLEKKMFQQTGKTSVRPETDADDSTVPTPVPEVHPKEDCNQSFETLKEATGGNTIDEVFDRFGNQKHTGSRLTLLRLSCEDQKTKLEKKSDGLTAQLETLKFAEVKDAEESAEELEALKLSIETEKQKIENHMQEQEQNNEVVKIIFVQIQAIYFTINPIVDTDRNPLEVFNDFSTELENIMNEKEKMEAEKRAELLEPEIIEEKLGLPSPYNGLIRRTPLPQQGPSATPAQAGSDEEEEVPSRGYMKRQAQIVVDAKSRRKNVRFPMKK